MREKLSHAYLSMGKNYIVKSINYEWYIKGLFGFRGANFKEGEYRYFGGSTTEFLIF